MLLLKSKIDALDCLRDSKEITNEAYEGHSLSYKDIFINDVWNHIKANK